MKSPVAMISYSSQDPEAAELLHDELALRCFEVIHDRHSFTDGSRIASNMEVAVDRCDVLVGYLTRHSLYLDHPADAPRPALTGELLPALARRRTNLGTAGVDKPIVILVSHGLGDRAAASTTIRELTGESVDTLWGRWLDQDTNHITQAEAADVAAGALRAFLRAEQPKPPIELLVATRGTTPPGRRFTLDGTRLLGGKRKPGKPVDWDRFLAALDDVRANLEAMCGGGDIRINLACHLSAAFAVGRAFHQATRWSPVFASRHGDVTPAAIAATDCLQGDLDPYAETGDLIVDIDLIGHGVGNRASELISRLPHPGARLSLSVHSEADFCAEMVACLARETANRVRTAHAKVSPNRIHVMMAAPTAYAGLLGSHLTALQAAVTMYELGEAGYVEALTLPSTMP
jgi:hypothetical protein